MNEKLNWKEQRLFKSYNYMENLGLKGNQSTKVNEKLNKLKRKHVHEIGHAFEKPWKSNST